MKLPIPAPDSTHLLNVTLKENPKKLNELLLTQFDDSAYLHWDQLRYKTPPAGLTHEEWWLALKLRRNQQRRQVELFDKEGNRFWFSMTDRLLRLSEEIARRAGASIANRYQILGAKNRESYIVRSLVEEAVTSSQLEGASTSRKVAVELLDSGRAPQDKSEMMIVNNYVAMQHVKESTKSPLSPDFVLELHGILTEGTLDDPNDAGRLETPDHDRVSVWDNETEVHAPPPAEELPRRLAQLCDFANASDAEAAYIPPVVRAIIIHFMMGFDHYFADGNGRNARTLFYWSMLREGYWVSEYVTISRLLKKAPSKYGAAYLFTEDDDGDLTYFIHYQLDVFVRALTDLDSYLNAKGKESAAVRAALADAGIELNFRQADLLEKLARQEEESTSALSFAHRYRVTDQTARADLDALTKRGYLVKHRKGRAFIWKATESLAVKLTPNS